MRGYPNGEQFWAAHREPNGDKNRYADDDDKHASSRPRGLSLALIM